jgi:hypothetical protein
MPANEFALPKLPDDFEVRCTATRRRIEAGEPMTIEHIAEQLGLSFELFAACCAVYAAAVHGVTVEIDAASRETTH